VLRLSTVQPQVSAAISERFHELLSEQIRFSSTFCTLYVTECGHVLTKINTHQQNISYSKEYHPDSRSPLGKYSDSRSPLGKYSDSRSPLGKYSDSRSPLGKYSDNSVLFHVPADGYS
jgi:hypothetical protein